MHKVAVAWLVIMLAVLGLGGIGRAAPPPQIIEVGENAACDYSTIAAAITNANPGDTIKVQQDTYNEPPLVVDKSLTFLGGYIKALYGDEVCLGNTRYQVTVHPAAPVASPIFRVQGANVLVEWFIFENSTDVGVAVDSGGTLDLVDTIVQNNGDEGLTVTGATANLIRADILGNTLAGVAVASGGVLDSVDSTIQNNGDEGLTVTGATANLLRTDTLGNTLAGVSVTSGGVLDSVDSTIQNNDDGGLSVVGATANLLRTKVLDNDRNYGGGIYMESGASVTASDSLIKGNQGWVQGAGVYLRTGSVFSAVNETGIERNRTVMGCDDGGGIAAIGIGTEVIIDASQVVSNTALHRGGGLYLAGGAQATIQNGSLVQENGAYGPVTGAGGGAHLTDGSTLHVDGGWFYQNWSDPYGGGIYADLGSTVQIAGTWFYANESRDSGGGIYNNGGQVTCRGCFFYLNRVVDYHGGAISSIGTAATLDVERTGFLQNSTDSGNGGAIFTDEPYTFVRRSYFRENTAPGDGSALYLSGLHLPPSITPQAVIENNYIVDNPTPAPVPDAAEATPAAVEEPQGPEGPSADGSSLYAESITAYLRHNTFAHQTQLPHFGVLADAEATVHMVNNILTNFNVAFHRYTTGTGYADASHTLFWSNLDDYGTGTLVSTNEVHGDPNFAGGTNYNLNLPSAAINAGTDAGVYLDYFGGSRPWGGGFEIGAEEYPRREHTYLPLVTK